jgi:hypothetical protein
MNKIRFNYNKICGIYIGILLYLYKLNSKG